jgi:hypothetical protein
MTPVLRGAIPVLMAAVALANTGCGSTSSERSPTSPAGQRPPVAGQSSAQGVRAMAAPPLGVLQNFAVLAGTTVTAATPPHDQR